MNFSDLFVVLCSADARCSVSCGPIHTTYVPYDSPFNAHPINEIYKDYTDQRDNGTRVPVPTDYYVGSLFRAILAKGATARIAIAMLRSLTWESKMSP